MYACVCFVDMCVSFTNAFHFLCVFLSTCLCSVSLLLYCSLLHFYSTCLSVSFPIFLACNYSLAIVAREKLFIRKVRHRMENTLIGIESMRGLKKPSKHWTVLPRDLICNCLHICIKIITPCKCIVPKEFINN